MRWAEVIGERLTSNDLIKNAMADEAEKRLQNDQDARRKKANIEKAIVDKEHEINVQSDLIKQRAAQNRQKKVLRATQLNRS